MTPLKNVAENYKMSSCIKNPPVGRPIVVGYNWILTPASLFVGYFQKEFYVKFDGVLKTVNSS